MTDSEDDSDILEDIKLLEDVLAKEKTSEASENDEDPENPETPEKPPKRRRISPENEPNSSPFNLNSSFFDPTGKSPDELIGKAFEMNEMLISKYREAKEAVEARLIECQRKQEELDLKIKLIAKGSKGNCSVRYSKAGYPYFKDSKHFAAPLNDDALLKSKRAELMVVYKRPPSRWTIKDRNALWMAVRLQAATEFFEKETKKQKNAGSNKDADQEPEIDLDKCQLPRNYKEMIGPLGSREFDWMKIAAQGFNNRHSADECRVMWNVYLHPDINRYKFNNAEDKLLKRLVEHHNYEDWESIAFRLETGRSGYQCFIRYTTISGPILLKNKDVWSNQENKILVSIVDNLRIGNYIPWALVAFYIDNRTKSQVYSHWRYHVDPTVRKGRFTVDEDEMLLEGVTKYGKDFPRIAKELIPHRTSIQLSGRFTLLMLKTDKSYNCWSVGEDMQLLKLFDEIGPQWSKIAEIMGKNRTYVRHRYTSINRFLAKGGELSDMSRKVEEETGPKDKTRIYDHAFLVSNYHARRGPPPEDIDTRLRKYFQMVQTPAAGPGRQPKYKDDAELARHTKQLYELCEKLDVRLEIPESLKIEGLSTRDRQLLASFKDYVSGRNVMNSEEIERTRIKMFGPDKPGNHTFYVPPPPFGLYFKPHAKRKRKKNSEKTVDEDCALVPDLKFETPENVEKMLSEEELEIFRKFSIFLSQEQPEVNSFEQKFITEEKAFEDEDDLPSSNDVTMISWGRKISKVINRDNEREQTTFVEPCHSTLHGYDTLRYMKETNNHLEWTKKEIEMSREPVTSAGKDAFHLFKTRFTRLFKYPIGMVRNAEAKPANSNLIILPRARCNQPDKDPSSSLDVGDSDD